MIKKFTYKGKEYQLDPKFLDESVLNNSSEFQFLQFTYLIETHDWDTLENRINNQLKHGGLIEITKTKNK
jgi:hypothetical protein